MAPLESPLGRGPAGDRDDARRKSPATGHQARGTIVNSADILVVLFVLLFLAVAWLTLRWMGNVIIRRRDELHRRLSEPRTHGDGRIR